MVAAGDRIAGPFRVRKGMENKTRRRKKKMQTREDNIDTDEKKRALIISLLVKEIPKPL